VLPYIEHNQLTPYYEKELRKHGHQKEVGGYSGMGYWFFGYPAYIGAMNTAVDHGTATPIVDQAQPDLDSKVTNAAAEVTGPDSNAGMAANTAPAGA
jgi:hypothetical protein